MGGVALAFIGMILEFITLSGFHPSVSIQIFPNDVIVNHNKFIGYIFHLDSDLESLTCIVVGKVIGK